MVKTNGSTVTVEQDTDGTAVAAERQALIQIDSIAAETLLVPIVGTSPLIVHRFSEKARKQMLDNMQGRKSPKQPKDPVADYEACFYKYDATPGVPARSGFPASGYQQSAISGARFYSNVTMTALRQAMFFRGERGVDGIGLFEIVGEPEMREDVVTVGRGTDLRYRPAFNEWTTTLRVTFVQSMLDRRAVLSLIDAGGMGVGVGEWRPEKNGEFGTFRIDPDREVVKVD